MKISLLVLAVVATLFVTGSHQTPEDSGCGCGGSRNSVQELRVKREDPKARPGNCNCVRCDPGKPCGCGCGSGGKLSDNIGRVKREEVVEPEPAAPEAEPETPAARRPYRGRGSGREGGRGGNRGGGRAGGRRYNAPEPAEGDGEIVAQPGYFRPAGRFPRPRPRRPSPFF